MRTKTMKTISAIFALVMVFALFAGCNPAEEEPTVEEPVTDETSEEAEETVVNEISGTILWLTYTTSGPIIETLQSYAEMVCNELGYELKVVYGSPYNDPAENLNAVKNGMTSDVVGIMLSQDGGLKDIMAEYPDLPVVGTRSDMASAFAEDGPSAEVLTNENFYGTMCDGYAEGADRGKLFAEAVINNGYKKVSIMVFPPFAFPQQMVAAVTFAQEIEAYNASVSEDEKIEIVGDTKVLEFSPLDETYFLEEGNGDLDVIVSFLAGLEFVYPTMKSAMINGTCSADTKLFTGGLLLEESVVADVGGDGVVQFIHTAPTESVAWALVMLDNAIYGNVYPDYTGPEQIDALPYIIDSKEDMENVLEKSMKGSTDLALAQLTIDDIKTVLVRFNPDATYADLNALIHSDQLSVESLMD